MDVLLVAPNDPACFYILLQSTDGEGYSLRRLAHATDLQLSISATPAAVACSRSGIAKGSSLPAWSGYLSRAGNGFEEDSRRTSWAGSSICRVGASGVDFLVPRLEPGIRHGSPVVMRAARESWQLKVSDEPDMSMTRSDQAAGHFERSLDVLGATAPSR